MRRKSVLTTACAIGGSVVLAARYFKQAGFTVLNDANNYSFDFGAAGTAATPRPSRTWRSTPEPAW